MKRIMALLLVLVLLLSATACSALVKVEEDGGKQDSKETKDESERSDLAPESESNELAEPKTDGSFEPFTAVDNDECSIRIMSLENDSFYGYCVNVQLENKSESKTYMFSLANASIDGVDCTATLAQEVAPGKLANDKIYFLDSELTENGLVDYTDLELTFRVYDTDDWLADDAAKETVHVYPYGEANASRFVREAGEADFVILDNEYVTAIVTGYEQDSLFGYTVKLFLVNKTDTVVMFSVEDASVNGLMLDPFYAKSVSAGKCAFSEMNWFDSKFEENGIETVENIEFTFRAYNYEDWLADDFANEFVTLTP